MIEFLLRCVQAFYTILFSVIFAACVVLISPLLILAALTDD